MQSVFQLFTRSFALISALFLTVITTKVRGQQYCGTNFIACAKPLSALTDSGLGFVATKQDLETTCPNFQSALKCIRTYTRVCMSLEQRKHFKKLFHGTHQMVQDLCTNATYQEEYLKFAPCMQQVEPTTKKCFTTYSKAMEDIQLKTTQQEDITEPDFITYQKRKREAADQGIKNVCCSFQEYLECSTSAMREACGSEAEQFSRNFLDQMSSAMIQTHCTGYGLRECGLLQAYSSAISSFISSTILVTTLILSSYLLR